MKNGGKFLQRMLEFPRFYEIRKAYILCPLVVLTRRKAGEILRGNSKHAWMKNVGKYNLHAENASDAIVQGV